MALKTAAPNQVLKKEEDTKRCERVCYATILCKEKQKDDAKYSRGCDGPTCGGAEQFMLSIISIIRHVDYNPRRGAPKCHISIFAISSLRLLKPRLQRSNPTRQINTGLHMA